MDDIIDDMSGGSKETPMGPSIDYDEYDDESQASMSPNQRQQRANNNNNHKRNPLTLNTSNSEDINDKSVMAVDSEVIQIWNQHQIEVLFITRIKHE